nr:retrovirus-related Pol polyprotein from transposon TNT 1-94 [Tanacetum cinerariifolium]
MPSQEKTGMDRNVHTFKDRLVAKGYTQTYNVDYNVTFSLVADTRAIRILLAIVAFFLYVDDILIMRNKVPMLQDVKSWLYKCFSMKDLGEATYILGIKITRDRSKRRSNLPMQEKPNLSKPQGYVFVLNGGAVDSKSVKQSTIAMSSTEVECITAAEASMEAVWMREFIDGHGNDVPTNKIPMKMLCDNTTTIAIANDPEIMKGARYYQWKYHYIHEFI